MAKIIHALWIDPEKSFTCENGALYVKHANEEAIRLAEMISSLKRGKSGHVFNKMYITIDEHHYNDIAHQTFWTNDKGEFPSLYTNISVDDVRERVWYPRSEASLPEGLTYYEMALNYVIALDAGGRNQLCIWPEHCIIGTDGCDLHPSIEQAVKDWSVHTSGYPDYVFKGKNPFTESYSAFAADVPRPDDKSTEFNVPFYNRLKFADEIVMGGWAGSHCGRWTILDFLNREPNSSLAKKCVLLEDAFAPVVVEGVPEATASYKNDRDNFLQEFKDRGGKITTTDKYVAI